MNVNTILMDMDVLIPEHIVRNSDDSYSIFINSRLSHDRQLDAFKHALKHIENDDFNKQNVDQVELEAHSA